MNVKYVYFGGSISSHASNFYTQYQMDKLIRLISATATSGGSLVWKTRIKAPSK